MNESAAHILSQLATPFTGEALFDQLADMVFFIKNARGEYAAVNSTLVSRCGLRTKADLIGRTPSELYPAPLGNIYETQDRRVLQTGAALLTQLELHIYPTRDVGWCLTTKLPLLGRDGIAVGLVGVSQDLRLPDATSDDYRRIASTVDYVRNHLSRPPRVTELASRAGMSRFQLDRRMQNVFGLTAGQWLVKTRIDWAQRQLTETEQPITKIAADAGYHDQSAFTRQFRAATGVSPSEFRRAQHR